MSEQTRKRDVKQAGRKDDASATPNPDVLEKGKKIKENIDKLLDEIDEVLEENAEEFVKSYIQKGGE